MKSSPRDCPVQKIQHKMADIQPVQRTVIDIDVEIAMLSERIETLKVERTASLIATGVSARGAKEIPILDRTAKQHRDKKTALLSAIRSKEGIDGLTIGQRRNICLYSYHSYIAGEDISAFRVRLVKAMEREWVHHNTEATFLLALSLILPPQDIEVLRRTIPVPVAPPAPANDVENPPAGA